MAGEIENENNNTLKTKGDHIEHNFGHGKKHLSSLLAAMNILAFLYHTFLSFTDEHYRLTRAHLPTRKTTGRPSIRSGRRRGSRSPALSGSASARPIQTASRPDAGMFTYTRRNPAMGGLSYTVWTSTNLTTWRQDTGAIQLPGPPNAHGVETVPVTLSPALLTGPQLFLRLRAAP